MRFSRPGSLIAFTSIAGLSTSAHALKAAAPLPAGGMQKRRSAASSQGGAGKAAARTAARPFLPSHRTNTAVK